MRREQGVRHQHLILLLVSVAAFVGALDSAIVNISLPSIARFFDVEIPVVSWVSMAYLLTLTATLVAFGRLADMRGYRRVYLAGFGIFTAASFLCGISAFLFMLIGSRVIQAIGAAMLQAISGAMITRYLPERERGRAIGIMATAVSLGVASGPFLGGFIAELTSWHWIFFVNIPVGIAAILAGLWVLPPDKHLEAGGCFDIAGAGFLFVTLGSLLFTLSLGRTIGYRSPVILASILLALGGATAFLYQEQRCPYPLLDLSLFRNPNYTLGNGAGLITMLLLNGNGFLMPFFLEGARGVSTSTTGLILMVPAIALMVTGPLSGGLSDRIGARPLCIAGSLLFLAAFVSFSRIDLSTPLPAILVTLVILGIASGTMNPASLRLILGWSPRGREGEVSSVAMTMRNMGSALGVAVFSAVFTTIAFTGTGRILLPDSQVTGFQAAYLCGFLLALVMLVFSIISREISPPIEKGDT